MYASSPYTAYLAACRTGVRAEVRLGSPRQPDCGGVGVCAVRLYDDRRFRTDACPQRISAYLRRDAPTGRLLVHFNRAGLTPFLRRRYLSDGCLFLPEPGPLSGGVREALDLDAPYDLAPGRYPGLEDDHFLTFSLGLARRAAGDPPHLRAAA
ncbi:hypothetical protein [Lewinella sp. IMCC34183]|uniref:hypothetical protein n=1 Tax=Lewinella sp. IMCC34183 TaxID=2248762 RepID=UPI000E25F49F|nr:hypothetical protein [Lewinella sp. IMCC34183]